MNISFKGKVALITGGTRGIGRATAVKFAENGADVAVIYAGNTNAAAQTVEELKSHGVKAASYKCDVADYNAVAETVKAVAGDFGHIDILVNNAGITRDKLAAVMSEADFDAVIGVNLKGAFNMIRHTCRGFIKNGGRIINIASVAGLSGNPGQANYAASKAGLIGMTKTVALELASRNVTCNAVAPGLVTSDMTNAMSDGAAQTLLNKIPCGRAGLPDDVAGAVLFLASDMASYITGETLRVDGGLYIS